MADVDQLARGVLGARDPVAALGRVVMAVSPVEAVHVVDSVFWRLPAYCDAAVLREAAVTYGIVGEPDAALLFDGFATQMDRAGRAPSDDADERARSVLAAPDPLARLLRALEDKELDAPARVELVLRVWGRLPPVDEYWIVYRAAEALELTGRTAGAMVMAAFALQLVPRLKRSEVPAERLLRALLTRLRYAAARSVAEQWLRPGYPDFAPQSWQDHLAAAFRVDPLPPRRRMGCVATEVMPAETRPPMDGLPTDDRACPTDVQKLRQASEREPITLYHLLDAEVFVAGDHVAVFGADGTPYPELSVGRPPALVRAAAAGAPTIARSRAVLVSDLFPHPNLCHFLCDQMPKLVLYRRAGLRLETASVIGAAISRPFQADIAARFGAGEWLATERPMRLRVAELAVLSTCAENQHPAHLGAAWALDAIRAAFQVSATGPVDRRLYVSRADAASRRVVNEAELLSVLLPAGFEVVVPGSLAIAEQAALFARASHVVGAHGAGLTNIAFCPPGTRVLELFHRDYGTYAFAVLAQAARLDYRPLIANDASLDGASPPDAPHGIDWISRDMRVDVAAVARWLAETRG